MSYLNGNGNGTGDVKSMKSDLRKEKKQRTSQSANEERPPCGTLAYLAESRGSLKRAGSSWHPRPSYDIINKIVKKAPADK
jgi:hypothetical protein